jgi:hypothetical protein
MFLRKCQIFSYLAVSFEKNGNYAFASLKQVSLLKQVAKDTFPVQMLVQVLSEAS